MNTFSIVLNHPDSEWGDDLVQFTLPDNVEPWRLMDEIECQKCNLNYNDFDCEMDYADELMRISANALGGTYQYVPNIGTVTIRPDDD